MRLIDTHAHLQIAAFDADRTEVIERARADGVRRIVNVGFDLPSSAAAIELAHVHDGMYATAGIQPHYAVSTGPDELDHLRQLLAAPGIVALGEIGLDYHHDRAPRPAQIELFETQLRLAAELTLPVVIHSREAHADTVAVLRRAAHRQPVIMHSFSGDWAYARECLELGTYLSFAGPLTFPKATELHDVAVRAPLERVLVETDCPYLTPHPFRGKRNEPARVRLTAERLAALRGLERDDVAEAVWHNACAAFGLADH